MIITALIYCIIILAILEGSCSALIFGIFTFIFELFQGIGGDYYFMGAILFDIAIIIELSRIKNNVKLNMNLMTISGSFLIINWLSWYLWEARLKYEFAYENISMLLYLGAIAILLNQDSIKNGYNKYCRQIGDFLMLNHKGHCHNNSISRKG